MMQQPMMGGRGGGVGYCNRKPVSFFKFPLFQVSNSQGTLSTLVSTSSTPPHTRPTHKGHNRTEKGLHERLTHCLKKNTPTGVQREGQLRVSRIDSHACVGSTAGQSRRMTDEPGVGWKRVNRFSVQNSKSKCKSLYN